MSARLSYVVMAASRVATRMPGCGGASADVGRVDALLEARSVMPGFPGEARAVVAAVRDALVPGGGWCRMWRESEL